MTDPSIEQRLGVTKLTIERKSITQAYREIKNPNNVGMMTGEEITFTVSGGTLHGKQIKTWSSEFPSGAPSLGLRFAWVHTQELVTMLLKGFPQDELAMLAMKYEDPDVRAAAVDNLTDQAVLAKVAMTEKDPRVVTWIIKRLKSQVADQTLLARLAVEAENPAVRKVAAWKLTDQPVLSKIAVDDNDELVREAAVEKLTDQSLLSKIAVEDNYVFVRAAAVEHLIDQELLSKIATEDKDSYVRGAAKNRLMRLRSTKP